MNYQDKTKDQLILELKNANLQAKKRLKQYHDLYDEYTELNNQLINEKRKLSKANLALEKSNRLLSQVIWESHETEEELRKSEKRYRLLFEDALTPILVVDDTGKYIDANAAALKFLECDRDELLTKHVWDFTPPEELDRQKKEHAPFTEPRILETNYQIHGKIKTLLLNVVPINISGETILYGIGQDITERKQTEATLKKQTILFETASRIAHIGAWEIDFEHDEINYSKELKRIHGLTDDPSAIDDVMQLAHPDDRHKIQKALDDALNGTKAYDMTHRITRQNDGELRWVHATGNVIFDEQNKPLKINGYVRDITERKQAERELSRIFNMATELICVANINTATFTRVNPAFSEVLGYDESELLDRPFLDFVHPDDVDDTISVIKNQLRQGISVISFVNRYRCKDGSYRWLDWNSHPKPEEGLTYAIATDITKQKRAQEKIQIQQEEIQLQNEELRVSNEELGDANRELTELMEKLQESETRYRTYIKNAPLGIFITDASGNYVDVNPAACQMTGYSREELINLSIPELDITDETTEDIISFDDLKESGRAKTERVLQHKNGSPINILLNAVKLSEDRFIGFCTDITQRKTMEEKLHLAEYTIENATYATFWVKSDGEFVRVNDTACSLLGYSREELMNMSVDDIDPNYPMEKRAEFWNKLKRSGGVTMETNHQTKSGKLIPVEISTFHINYNHQEYEVAMSRDITERKHAEEKLQRQQEEIQMQNEELRVSNEELGDANRELIQLSKKLRRNERDLQLTLEATTEGIWTWNFQTDELEFSPRYYTMLGYSPNEFPANFENWKNLIHPDDVESAMHTANEWLKTKSDRYENEFRLRTKDGDYRWIRTIGKVVERDKEGNAIRMIGNHEDITERKHARQRIKINEDRLSSLLTLTDMKAYSEKEVINFALEEAVRLTQSEIGYFHFIDEDKLNLNRFTWSKKVVDECNASNIQEYPIDRAGIWMDSFRNGEPVIHNDYQTIEKKGGYPDGHVHIIRHMSVPIFNGNRIVAVAGVGNKETAYEDFDVKQLTLFMNSMWGILKNKRATDELKSTLEDKTALIQELYHRTRNNMQVICSMLSLKTQYLDDESIIQIFKEMKNRIYSMSLVHEKLYQAQHLSRLNLNSYFRELAHLNMENYRSALRRVDIKCDMESMQVLFDTAIPCGLVLNELLSNAFKFAFPENREGTITIGLHKPEPDVIEFSVSDDGVGVPEDFDWRQDGDFGLGIVKIVAEHQLQGTVEFDSQNGVTWKISFKKGFYSERV